MKPIEVITLANVDDDNLVIRNIATFPYEIRLSDLQEKLEKTLSNYFFFAKEEASETAIELLDNINMKGEMLKYRGDNLNLVKSTYEFKKYELLDEDYIILDNGEKAYRIKAIRDIEKHDVKQGDLGGYVQGIFNLSQDGDCWVSDNAVVSECAEVRDEAMVFGNARIEEFAKVYESASVDGNAVVSDEALVYGNAIVTDTATIEDHARIYDSAKVMGNSNVCCGAKIYGNAELYQNAYVCDNALVYGKAILEGNCMVQNHAQVCGNAHLKEEDNIVADEIVSNNDNEKIFMDRLEDLTRHKDCNIKSLATKLYDILKENK